MYEVELEDIHVLYVESANGPEGGKAAFDELERHFPSMEGRKFYGAFIPQTDVYRACVAMEDGDDPKTLALPSWIIPGGRYSRRKLKDWQEHIPKIGKMFMVMGDEVGDGYDASRPSVEFYRSRKELILMLPVK